jgi:hypothetical protein
MLNLLSPSFYQLFVDRRYKGGFLSEFTIFPKLRKKDVYPSIPSEKMLPMGAGQWVTTT